jgi:hypothetical protein
VNDDPDIPNDPSLPRLAGRRIRDGDGTYSRTLRAGATTRRHRARQMRDGGDHAGAAREDHDADYLDSHAERMSDPLRFIGAPLVTGNGGEVVTPPPADLGPDAFQKAVQQPPDMLAAEASEHRMILTASVSKRALTLALELAESIGAETALERDLAHQVAATHAVGMEMLAKAHASTVLAAPWVPEERQQMQSIEATRMARAAARVIECSQRGMLVLERLRNGGRQTVTVQHVTVGQGGQAVVAGSVKQGRGGRK